MKYIRFVSLIIILFIGIIITHKQVYAYTCSSVGWKCCTPEATPPAGPYPPNSGKAHCSTIGSTVPCDVCPGSNSCVNGTCCSTCSPFGQPVCSADYSGYRLCACSGWSSLIECTTGIGICDTNITGNCVQCETDSSPVSAAGNIVNNCDWGSDYCHNTCTGIPGYAYVNCATNQSCGTSVPHKFCYQMGATPMWVGLTECPAAGGEGCHPLNCFNILEGHGCPYIVVTPTPMGDEYAINVEGPSIGACGSGGGYSASCNNCGGVACGWCDAQPTVLPPPPPQPTSVPTSTPVATPTPTTPPVGVPDCRISVTNPLVTDGSPFNVSFSGYGVMGETDTVNLYVQEMDGNLIAPSPLINPTPPGGYSHIGPVSYPAAIPSTANYDFVSSCTSTNQSQCSRSVQVTLPAGTYFLHCNTMLSSPPNCSGNPFCSYEGQGYTVDCSSSWYSCSNSDNFTIFNNPVPTIAPTPTPWAQLRARAVIEDSTNCSTGCLNFTGLTSI